jgi:HEAT repeat protein
MTKHYPQKLAAILTFTLLSCGAPLLLSANALALENRKPEVATTEIVPLIAKLKSNDDRENNAAIKKLGEIGEPAIPALIQALGDKNLLVSRSAREVLKTIGSSAIPALVKASKDSDEQIRRRAADLLAEKGLSLYILWHLPSAAKVLPGLIALLKDSDADVRGKAAYALGNIGAESKAAVPVLIPLLKDSDAGVRGKAAYALGSIGAESKAAVPVLIPLLKDSDANVRSSAASALGSIGAEAKAVVPALIPLLKDSDRDVRGSAAYALANIGAEAKAAVPELIPLLKDSEEYVRRSATYALKKIALNIQDQAKTLSPTELDLVIRQFESALKILEEPKANFSKEDIATIRLSIEALKAKRNAHLFNLIRQNKWVAAAIIYLIFFPSFWSAILRLRPLWILQINDALKSYDFKLPETWGGAPIRIRDLTFIRFFIYHPRVLDAWVSTHIETVREQFTTQETVEIRATYIPVSFKLDNKKVTDIRCQELQSTFTKNRIRLLIWGEGGIGKTSIACQIADWAMKSDQSIRLCTHLMIPILIEEELKNVNEDKDSFLTAINGQLKSIADLPEPADEELLKQLLQQRRLLVIVDHFSEMSEATQKAILPNSPDFPVNALVVTSRLESSLGKANKTTLHPLRIEGSELSDFMQKYLEKLGKIHLFGGSRFHYACGDLAKLLEGIENQGRSTTVLFAKLYTDVLIANKTADNTRDDSPKNIPDLMLSYLNEINRDVAEDKVSDNEVHEIAKMLAWECLKVTYRPTSIKIKDALNALSALNLQDTGERLKYLEDKLRILQRKGSSKDNISFVLDPVAEYLAGLHLVDICAKNQSKWQKILDRADSLNSLEAIKGFMLAVRDCYLAKVPDAKSTDYLPIEIATRYNIPITTAQTPQPVTV